MQHTTGIIFDLDGTLIDSLIDIALNANSVLSEFGYPTHTIEAYKQFVGDGARMLLQNALPNTIEKTQLDEMVERFKEVYETNLHTHTKEYDSISEMLAQCNASGYALGVLSNKPHKLTNLYIEKLFGEIAFVSVQGQKDTVPKKPDPVGALMIANAMGIEPTDIFFVGDTATDMKTAKNAGMVAIGVLWGFRSQDELIASGADFLVSHPSEIVSIIINQASK